MTFDWENVPVEPRAPRARRGSPSSRRRARWAARRIALDEKTLFRRSAFPPRRFAAVDTPRGPRAAPCATLGLPGVLKTRRLGYDGKGQPVLRRAADVAPRMGGARQRAAALRGLRAPSTARSRSSACAAATASVAIYPLDRQPASRRHPAPRRARPTAHAGSAGSRRSGTSGASLTALDYVGVLAIEFFVVQRPPARQRDGAARAQLRATGPSRARRPASSRTTCAPSAGCRWRDRARAATAAMLNLIGTMPRHGGAARRSPRLHLHDYGKSPAAGPQAGPSDHRHGHRAAGSGRAARLPRRESAIVTARCALR